MTRRAGPWPPALLALLLAGTAACSTTSAAQTTEGSGSDTATTTTTATVPPPSPSAAPSPTPLAQLPRGGRSIFPRHVVVMAYGTAGTGVLGLLGEVAPDVAARRLQAGAVPFAKPSGRVVLPAFELITTIAQRSPGPDGSYSRLLPYADVQRYLDAARKAKMLLVLDFQPGRSDFLAQVKHYERFLLQPDVGVALDPEWVLRPGQLPSRQIGTTDAATVNRVSSYVAGLTIRNRLPEKIFIVHQFQTRMIADRDALVDRPGLATVIHVDGFGPQKAKKATYRVLADTQGAARPAGRVHNGFKLFLDEDTDLMTPAEAMALVPQPELVSYQ